MSRCEQCPFMTKAISGKGPKDSPFVIVGESPGSREIAVGKPFVGPSGQMLDNILSRCGFDSLGIKPYVINAINCYPANKDLERLERGCRACAGRVHSEIAEYPRKVILTLGAAAAWSVTGDYGIRILASRGEIRKSPLASEGVVLAVHPAYVLRNGSALSVWKKDIEQAVKLLKGQAPDVWSEPTWSVIHKPSQYNDVVDEYISGPTKLVTGDTETGALHWMDEKMLCLGITKGDGSHVDVITEDMLYKMPNTTKRLMEAPSIRWNWHNGLFDIKWFMYGLGIEARVDEDTMLLSYALNENKGYHDLDQVAQHWIKAPRHKHMLDAYLPNKKTSYRVIPKDVLYKYNAIDLSKTHCVWAPIREAVRSDSKLDMLYTEQLLPAVPFLAEMQLYGVKADEDRIRKNELLHDEELADLRAQLNVYAQKHLGHDINLNSPLQLKSLLYGKMGFGKMTDSTDEKSLINIQRIYDHPIIDILLKHREVAKRKGTYVSNLLERRDTKVKTKIKIIPGHIKQDGRIHGDYALHKTSTGRLAGSEPNLLNQPRGPMIRSQYVAKPGHLFVEVDLNQAELRSLALMSGDPVLVELYNRNEESIHDITTAAFFASKKEMADPEVLKRCAHQLQYFGEMTPSAVYKEAKMRGKAVNFGIVYGREAFSLAKEFNIPVAEAQRWIEKWFDTYSGARDFIEWCRAAPMQRRTLVTVYGRKKRFGAVTNENLRNMQNEAANFPHQSTASDIMLEVAFKSYKDLRSRWNARVWNELYDAVYYEIPVDEPSISESVQFIQQRITQFPKDRGLLRVPFLGDAKIGFTWGDMHDYDPLRPITEQMHPEFIERFQREQKLLKAA